MDGANFDIPSNSQRAANCALSNLIVILIHRKILARIFVRYIVQTDLVASRVSAAGMNKI